MKDNESPGNELRGKDLQNQTLGRLMTLMCVIINQDMGLKNVLEKCRETLKKKIQK